MSGTRYVSGESIEADLEDDITSVNPPTLQGWAYVLFVVAAAVVLLGMATLRQGESVTLAVAEIVGVPLVWVLALAAWGFGQRSIELTAEGVRVRRWTDVWFDRVGVVAGAVEDVHARMDDGKAVVLDGSDGSLRVGIRTWGSTARADILDELPTWGIDCDFGHHQHRHHH